MIAALERIAAALERIADAMAPEDVVDEPEIVANGPTLINPLLTWFSRIEAAPEAVSDALGDVGFADLQPTRGTPRSEPGVIVQRGRPKNRVSHCGRCGREDTRRMNHSDSCRECVHEAWWTE